MTKNDYEFFIELARWIVRQLKPATTVTTMAQAPSDPPPPPPPPQLP